MEISCVKWESALAKKKKKEWHLIRSIYTDLPLSLFVLWTACTATKSTTETVALKR
jgi:hypothetical protein